jgi:hypothetical protein
MYLIQNLNKLQSLSLTNFYLYFEIERVLNNTLFFLHEKKIYVIYILFKHAYPIELYTI